MAPPGAPAAASPMRYLLHHHPALPGLLSREDLHHLVDQGILARSDLCTDARSGREHTVGEVIRGLRRPDARSPLRIDRPAYREIRADGPEDANEAEPFDDDAIEEAESDADLLLYQGRRAWLGHGKALFLALLLLIAAGLLLRFDLEYAVVSLLCAAATLTGVAISRLAVDYIVTPECVEVASGILGRSSKELRICDIQGIDVDQGGLKGLLGLGSVRFSTTAGPGAEVQFRDIPDAHEVKRLVRQLQRDA